MLRPVYIRIKGKMERKEKCNKKKALHPLDTRLDWCPDPELNQGHGDFQSPALPTELSGQIDYHL